MMKRYITRIAQIKNDIKKHKEMLDDALINNQGYTEQLAKVKNEQKELKRIKAMIMSQPSNAQLTLKVKNMRQESKEMQLSLSDYCQEFERMTGANEIEGEDGSLYDFNHKVNLVKRSAS